MEALIAALSDPLFAGLSDQEAADTLNSRRVTVRRPVPQTAIKQHAALSGFYATVRLASLDSSTSVEVRRHAINALAWVDDATGNMPPIDLDAEEGRALLSNLVACGLLTDSQAAALAALADNVIPWTESVGLPEIGVGLVQNARRMNGG